MKSVIVMILIINLIENIYKKKQSESKVALLLIKVAYRFTYFLILIY